jgi:hypothetical protein
VDCGGFHRPHVRRGCRLVAGERTSRRVLTTSRVRGQVRTLLRRHAQGRPLPDTADPRACLLPGPWDATCGPSVRRISAPPYLARES